MSRQTFELESRGKELNSRKKVAILLFLAGIACPPSVFIASGLVAGPGWTGSSALLDLIALPLVFLGAGLCFAAPLLLPVGFGRRVIYLLLAMLTFTLVGVAVGYFCLMQFGIPIR